MTEQNSEPRTLLDCQVEFCDPDGNTLFSIDLLEAQLHVEHLYEHGVQAESGKYADYLAEVRAWLAERNPGLELTISQVWCFIEQIKTAWDQFKKKFETALTSPITTESTPSSSAIEQLTTTPPNCPDSPPSEN